MEKRRLHAGPQTLGKSIFCNRHLKVRGVTKEERKLGTLCVGQTLSCLKVKLKSCECVFIMSQLAVPVLYAHENRKYFLYP